MKEKEANALILVLENLKRKNKDYRSSVKYQVPSLWIAPGDKRPKLRTVQSVNPYEFYIHHIESILQSGQGRSKMTYKGTGGFWIGKDIVYNIFPRLATAYDHNSDGVIGGNKKDVTLSSDGIRETGTFLKTLALLGHIRALQCDVIYFLPITAIGRDGNKGDLGSPYAIRNPYELDEKLADPLCDLDITVQFKALVEACHILGMKVILEFVFRTGAKDSDWIPKYPDWFYWIDNDIQERSCDMSLEEMKRSYGSPVFSPDVLKEIKRKVAAKDFANLPPPPVDYRRMFKLPPSGPGKITKNHRGKYIGISLDPETQKEVTTRIPGAFADWPPDDIQPPWTDVTYLKLYRDENPSAPRFNYIAYNTVRMYDTELAKENLANRPLWDKIRDIVPHYQKTFGINGVMVDMGHALPPLLMGEIVSAARSIDPDFSFLSEDFSVEKKSLDAGYNIVLGYSWSVQHKKDGMAKLLRHAGTEGMPLSFFATSETHNTPRSATKTGGTEFSKNSYVANCFIPHGIPFIHNGFELGETYPVNTGLEFSPEELEFFREKTLPLFDRHGFDWMRPVEFSDFIEKVNRIRKKYGSIIFGTGSETFAFIPTGNANALAFKRIQKTGRRQKILCILISLDYEAPQNFTIAGESFNKQKIKDLLYGSIYLVSNDTVQGTLKPGGACIFYYEQEIPL